MVQASPGTTATLVGSNQVLVLAEDEAKGAGGAGQLSVSVCPSPAADRADVYFYDHFPLADVTMGAPPLGYGATQKASIYAMDCCIPGTTFTAAGVRAVVLRQNLPTYLNPAEVEIYAASDPTTNIASTATCYALPHTGGWYNGDRSTGLQPRLNDGDPTTLTHSGAPTTGNGKDFVICVLPEPTVLAKVKLYPQPGWGDRSQNWTLAVYANVGMEDGPDLGPVRVVGKLWERLVEHPWTWDAGEEYTIPQEPQTAQYACDDRASPLDSASPQLQYSVAQGQAYALVDVTGQCASSESGPECRAER